MPRVSSIENGPRSQKIEAEEIEKHGSPFAIHPWVHQTHCTQADDAANNPKEPTKSPFMDIWFSECIITHKENCLVSTDGYSLITTRCDEQWYIYPKFLEHYQQDEQKIAQKICLYPIGNTSLRRNCNLCCILRSCTTPTYTQMMALVGLIIQATPASKSPSWREVKIDPVWWWSVDGDCTGHQ